MPIDGQQPVFIQLLTFRRYKYRAIGNASGNLLALKVSSSNWGSFDKKLMIRKLTLSAIHIFALSALLSKLPKSILLAKTQEKTPQTDHWMPLIFVVEPTISGQTLADVGFEMDFLVQGHRRPLFVR